MLGLNSNLKIAIIYPPKIPIVLPRSTKTGIQINEAIIFGAIKSVSYTHLRAHET